MAAQDCIDNENASFDPLNKNWYTLKENEDWRRAIKRCQWCHGAVGIGLARIGTEKLSGLHYRHTREDTERAVLATRLHLNKASDTLCCGTLGGIEFFFEASRFLNNPALHQEARVELEKMIIKTRRSENEIILPFDNPLDFSLFRGSAGLGYTALRQLDLNLPNILIWE